MQKKSMKVIVSLLAGITLGSSVIGSGVSMVNASESMSIQNHTYLKNMNKVLLEAGLKQSEIDRASFSDKQIIYNTLLEKSEKGRFSRALIKALEHVKGSAKKFIEKFGVVLMVAEAIKLWDDYDGEPSRIIYHVFRYFGASRYNASRWTHMIMDIIDFVS